MYFLSEFYNVQSIRVIKCSIYRVLQCPFCRCSTVSFFWEFYDVLSTGSYNVRSEFYSVRSIGDLR